MGNFNSVNILFLILTVTLSQICSAQTISEFRGPGRTGIYNETELLKEWPESGPEKLWSADDLGKGYTSPAMGKDYIYVTGRIDTMDFLTALDYNGKTVWQVEFGRSRNKSYPDTRCIPTINGDKIYLVSGMGEVACHDLATGERIWKRNAFEEFSGIPGPHGIAESPLVVDDKVFFTPAGFETTMIALDKFSGELIWKTKSLNDSTAYVSPLFVNHNGQKMIIQLIANTLFGVDPSNGQILWDFNYIDIRPPEENPKLKWTNCNTPIYHNGELFVTKGYNHPAAMFVLDENGRGITLKWTNDLLDTHHGGDVLIDGYLYGSTWIHNADGNWACIDWETGEDKWEAEMNNKGSIIAADGMLYCYDEKRGQLALVKPTPEKFDIVSSFRIDEGSGPHWAHPLIHNGIMYIRHGEVLMTFDVRD
jgi:outer membrane protein assembly factor BamB